MSAAWVFDADANPFSSTPALDKLERMTDRSATYEPPDSYQEPLKGTRTSVVVGFDGSEAAERALERAAVHAGADGRVVVVTARPTTGASMLTDDPILDAPSPAEQRELLRRSRVLLGSRGARAEFLAIDGDPAEALISVARSEDAALIVVGRTGNGFVTRALLGSTPENVLRHAPCDVLVVV
jgi:nucleotide-binding universal stress UspA family protein